MQRTHRSLWLCTLLAGLAVATLALPPPAYAGVRVSIGVGVPVYPAPVVVAPAPVVVAPPPAVVYPAPVVVAHAGGYYGHPYRHWGHHHWRRW
jgi:hypothetical protein